MKKNFSSTNPLILGIDTSCDETSASVVRGVKVLSNVMPSQIEFHSKYGGVVPSLAKLAHTERIDNVVKEALKRARVTMEQIDAVAVTYGPGLAIALEVGLKKAKELAEKFNKPLIAINHMEGHLLSSFVEPNGKKNILVKDLMHDYKIKFKKGSAIGVLVSGGHTEIILVKDFFNYQKIGETEDDACGECLDKCARMLGLGYPGGPVISKLAKENKKNIQYTILNKNQSRIVTLKNINTGRTYQLPVPMAFSPNLNFSYSGLKTAFSSLVSSLSVTKDEIFDLCSIIEIAAFEEVRLKVFKAFEKYSPFELWLGGGVVANAHLKSVLRKVSGRIKVKVPYSNKLTGDNASMIALAGALRFNSFVNSHNPKVGIFTKEYEKIDREPNLSL